MVLGGLQKLTLLDFPEHVACTVFTLGCNFRCPFCHNAPLVIANDTPTYSTDDFFAFLEKRRGILDGVAITGGEPLLQKDIEDFLKRIKDMGFAVKLDTNGSYPEKLQNILKNGLVDYVAMDIKNSKEKYEKTVGAKVNLADIEKSADILLNGNTAFEFRTTAVKQLHKVKDFEEIGKWIKGAKNYFIQQFKDSENLIENGFTSPTSEEMQAYLESVQKYVPMAKIRGL